MSRYGVDKVCWQITKEDQLLSRFLNDRAEMLAGYDLTEQEQRAFIENDFVTLYQMGANPYLLSQWASLVLPNGSDPDFRSWYAAALRPHGRPDFAT